MTGRLPVAEDELVDLLRRELHRCRFLSMKFNDCLAEARKQFNREVKAEADATPLPR